MKKMYWFALAVCVCVFVYFGGKSFFNYLSNLKTTYTYYIAQDSDSGTLAFQQTPEDSKLLNSYLIVNTKFIEDGINDSCQNDKKLNDGYLLTDYFPDFKTYYAAKLKLEKAIFQELGNLYTKTHSLNNVELSTFFNNNSKYLDEYFGIVSLDEFKNVVLTLSSSNNSNIASAKIVKASVSYNPYSKATLFRLKVLNESGDVTTFSVNIYQSSKTTSQESPLIMFSSPGGVS